MRRTDEDSHAGDGGWDMNGYDHTRFCTKAALVFLAIAGLVLAAGTRAHASIKWLAPGELAPGEVLIPDLFPPEKQTKPPKIETHETQDSQKPQLEKVRIAVLGGDESKLAGLDAHDAPFETVKPSANPDLVWDPASHNVSSGSGIVAYGVDLASLAPVINRTAVLRALSVLAAKRPQVIKLAPPSEHVPKGKTQIVVDDVAYRALLVIDISGDGAVQIFYPVGADPRVVDSSPYKLPPVTMGAPYGTDVFLAITASKPIDILEQRMRETPAPNATELLALINQTLPQDALVGLLSVTSAP
jgi:hypothetical protein